MVDVEWKGRGLPGAVGWGRMVGTMLHRAGIPADTIASLLGPLWEEHARRNLWSLVPEGLGDALDAARAGGVKVALVSNSEGMLEELFVALGVRGHFDSRAGQRQGRSGEAGPANLPAGAGCVRRDRGGGAPPRRLDRDRRSRRARRGDPRRAHRPLRSHGRARGGRAAGHRGRRGGTRAVEARADLVRPADARGECSPVRERSPRHGTVRSSCPTARTPRSSSRCCPVTA